MTTNYFKQVVIIRNRSEFKWSINTYKGHKVCEWYFNGYVFGLEDIAWIPEIECEYLSFSSAKYEESINGEKTRQLVLRTLLSLKNIGRLYLNAKASQTLFLASDLHKFVYRYRISQSLTNIRFVIPQQFNHWLARGLDYATGLQRLVIIAQGYRGTQYDYRYFEAPNLQELSYDGTAEKNCFALFRVLEARRELKKVKISSSFIPNSAVLSKCFTGLVVRSMGVESVTGIRPRGRDSMFAIYQELLFKELGSARK